MTATAGATGKECVCQCRRQKRHGSVPGSGRSPGGGNSKPLQHSCLENPMDRGAWQATVHGVTRVRHDWSGLNTHTQAGNWHQRFAFIFDSAQRLKLQETLRMYRFHFYSLDLRHTTLIKHGIYNSLEVLIWIPLPFSGVQESQSLWRA